MDKSLLNTMLNKAVEAVTHAGAYALEHYNEQGLASTTLKTENDTLQSLTKTDIEAEKIILGTLRTAFPNHSFFSEETGDDSVNSAFRWIIDPIDGTSNYSRQLPYFCVTAAATYEKEPVLGVVYQPFTKELFTGLKDHGAYLNGKAIRPSEIKDLSHAFVCFDKGKSMAARMRFPKIIETMTPLIRSPRALGTGALQACYAACGKFDVGIFNGMAFYDVTAPSVIAREAGASVTDFSGKAWSSDSPEMLICHPRLKSKLIDSLAHI